MEGVGPEIPVVPLGRHHETQCVGQLVAEQCEYAGCRVVGQFVDRRVHGAGDVAATQIEGLARLDVDEAAEATFDVIGPRRLVDVHGLDQPGLECMKADDAGFRVRRPSPVVAARRDVGCRDAPADRRLDELRSKTPDTDERALAALPVDGDPADPLQGLGQVLIGECADVLGSYRVQEVVRVLFPVEGLAQADPDADDDHLLDRPGSVDDRLPR